MEENVKRERIERELERISSFYQLKPSDHRKKVLSLLEPLIKNAAFMRVTLEDLQEAVNRDGAVEVYQNGANQKGVKQSAALQSYNTLIKNYTSVMKQLSVLLPNESSRLLCKDDEAETPEERQDREDYEAMIEQLGKYSSECYTN